MGKLPSASGCRLESKRWPSRSEIRQLVAEFVNTAPGSQVVRGESLQERANCNRFLDFVFGISPGDSPLNSNNGLYWLFGLEHR